MIPPQMLHPGAQQILVEYLIHEANRALGERRPMEENWKRWHKVYKAMPEQQIKTFPFYGSSNLVIPVAATDVDVVTARLLGILFAPDNLLSTRARRPEMLEFSRVLQEFLQAVQFTELNAYDSVADWVMELTKLGTGILKTRYRREHKMVYEYRESQFGTTEQHRKVLLKDHPEICHVSLWDFLVPASAVDIPGSPWVGERVLLTWQQYMNRVREGIYVPNPRMQNWAVASKGSHVLEHLMRMDQFVPGIGDKLELWEFWVRDFDITNTGEPRALVATIHLPTYSVARLDFNPYISQEYPYDRARFLRQEKRFYGIGMCEMTEMFQDEVTAMHNQRIDNGTLANSLIFLGKNGAVTSDEPIYPGRWFIVNDMSDIQTLPMTSGKMDSSVQYEPMTLQYSKNRTGVNEHVAGQFAPSIGYATAHTNLQQLQQATQRFDQTLREIRGALSSAGMKVVELYQQFDRPGRAFELLGQKDGAIMQAFIQFPIQLIRDGVAIEVTATSASLNKETEIRTNTIMMQMLTQFYRDMVDGLMLAFTPNMPPPIQQAIFQSIQGGSILMRRILESQGTQDTDDLVPHIGNLIGGNLPIGRLSSDALLSGAGGIAGANGIAGGGFAPAGVGAGPQQMLAPNGGGFLLGSGPQAPGGNFAL